LPGLREDGFRLVSSEKVEEIKQLYVPQPLKKAKKPKATPKKI